MKAAEKLDVREIRRKLGMNQQQFWSRLGVTQSGDIAKIKREDFEVVEYLKASDPELFKSLKKQARASQKKGG